MTMTEEQFVTDLWNLFRDHVDSHRKEAIAEQYVDILIEHGVSEDVIKSSMGNDAELDKAICYCLEIEDEESEDW